jgi:hypothetical protein
MSCIIGFGEGAGLVGRVYTCPKTVSVDVIKNDKIATLSQGALFLVKLFIFIFNLSVFAVRLLRAKKKADHIIAQNLSNISSFSVTKIISPSEYQTKSLMYFVKI